jgi:dihydroflavonol-4-reductase
MHILVTGANGHIGSHVVRAARDAGAIPIAFVRPGSDRRAVSGVACEVREGDLCDPESVARALKGVEAVMHVGAVHRNSTPDPEAMLRPAIEGTRAVLDAATRAGVRRVVLTSSAATIGFAKDPAKPFDESHYQESTKSVYIRAKVEQERLALTYAQRGALDLVVVNPSGVVGPRDYRLTPATRALIGLLQGDPAFLHLCLTDVRDVARAHFLALEKGRTGERYLITGDIVAPKQLSGLIFAAGGVRPPVFRPPMFLLRFIVGRAEKKAAREGSDPPTTLAAIDDVDGGHLAYDSTRSRRDLGVTYRDAGSVLTDAFRWLLHVEALKPKVALKVRRALGDAARPDADWT